MFLNILSSILASVALYSILTIVFKVPSFKVSGEISKRHKISSSKKVISAFVKTIATPIAKFMPVSMMKEVKLERMLHSADSTETPKQYVAKLFVTFILISLLCIPLLLLISLLNLSPLINTIINVIVVAIILIGAVITVVIIHSETKDKAAARVLAIENELPRFIQTFTDSIKTNRNVIDIIETYKQNYDTELTRELSITVADMRTGSPELALQHLEMRANNLLLSELIRGVLATMRGEDMTIYFDTLVYKVKKIWQQRLTQQALKIKPKLSTMSIIRALWSIVILLVVVMTAVFLSAKL